MKKHILDTRSHLGELHGLARETEAAERRILERATRRLGEVETLVERARPGAESAPDKAQQRYLDLVQERGQLQAVIAKAKKVLGQ